MRVFNFSAGPAMLPKEVMERAKEEFCSYGATGCGVIELSHRGKEFTEIIERAIRNTRELLNLSDEYSVLFIQGGASLQFAMIPMNLLAKGGFAEYVDSGVWASTAIKEAGRFGELKVIGSSKSTNYDRIPEVRHFKPNQGSSYLHITSNNTIYGTQYHYFPEMPREVPLIADMSSDIMSRVIDVNDFGLIYAGMQKNLGPSGCALVLIRKDLVERANKDLPTMLRYSTYVDHNSLFNTPSTFAIYLYALVTDWMKKKGGISAIEEINDAKSEALYETIDNSDFYKNPVEPSSRSRMNVVFTLPNDELGDKFVKEAAKAGLTGLKGHRSVGGIRASIYNAMPLEGVEVLIDFMHDFEKSNG